MLIDGQQEKRTCDQLMQSMFLSLQKLGRICAYRAAKPMRDNVQAKLYPRTRSFTTVQSGNCVISVPFLIRGMEK